MNPHLDQPIVYRGKPITPGQPVILGLHGRGQTPDVIADIFERLRWNEASLVAPAAEGSTWYPKRFIESVEANEPHLSYALKRVDLLIQGLAEQGVQRRDIILLGFSQGACLAAEYAVRHAGRYRGIALFTGGVIGAPGTQWNYGGAFQDTPALITSGDPDSWVPVERVKETISLFLDMGAVVTAKIFIGREHLVCEEEVEMARRLFQ